jgi:hypothetical protein
MGNPITNNLPDEVDSLLQDVAQMHGGFGYFDVIRFSKVCTKEDLRSLNKIAKFFNDREGDVTEKQIHSYSEKVVRIVHDRLNKNKRSVW